MQPTSISQVFAEVGKVFAVELERLHERIEQLEAQVTAQAQTKAQPFEPIPSDFVNKAQAMHLLQCKSTKLWELVQAGAIRSTKDQGRSHLYLRSDLDKVQLNGKAARLAIKQWKDSNLLINVNVTLTKKQ